MKFAARAVVALSLLVGLYVLAAGLVIALGFLVYEGMVHGIGGVLLGKGGALLLVVALAVGRAMWTVRRARKAEPTGLAVSAEEQPALWEEVRSLAEIVGTRTPDTIRLVPQVNAAVGEDSRFLGLVPGRRDMVVGVPLLLGLTRQQMRAVLAHELGHYSHRHTALGPAIYRGNVTLGQLVGSLGPDTWTGKLFAAYGRMYLRLTRSLTRQQEVEADAWSHRVAGRSASAGAMRTLPALDAMWDLFLAEYACAVPGTRPEVLFAGFEDLLASPRRQQEMQQIKEQLPEEEQDPYDTHPSLSSRVAYFESLPEDGVPDDGRPAADLLTHRGAVLGRLEEEMFSGSDLEPRPWPWLSETAGARRARLRASMLVRATDESGYGAATLQEALRTLARHDAHRLVGPVVAPDTPPVQVDSIARMLVGDAIAAALIEHCGARFTLDWDGNDRLVDPTGAVIDVPALVTTVADGRAADSVLEALAAEGVPPTFAVDLGEVDAEAAMGREAAVHSVVACVSWRRLRILVVSDDGLIVKRMGIVEGVAAALRHGGMDPYRTAVRHVAAMPLSRLLEDRRAATVPWDRVGHARFSGTRLALGLNGKNHRMRVQAQAVAGDLLGSLQRHLGERLTVA